MCTYLTGRESNNICSKILTEHIKLNEVPSHCLNAYRLLARPNSLLSVFSIRSDIVLSSFYVSSFLL